MYKNDNHQVSYQKYSDYMEKRIISEAEYISENKATVRACAKMFSISKSTVHKDMTERLKLLSPYLYNEVSSILQINKKERHIRGGLATKQMFFEKKAHKQ